MMVRELRAASPILQYPAKGAGRWAGSNRSRILSGASDARTCLASSGIAAPGYDELRAAESVPFIHSSVARVKK